MLPTPHTLERELDVAAPPAILWSFLTDSARFAAWWGAGSSLEPRVEGAVEIVYPNGIRAGGRVLEVEAGRRIAFTFGYASGEPVPRDASRVEFTLTPEHGGTRVRLVHALPDAAARDAHVGGWRYHLAVLANLATDEAHAGAARRLDRFFELWAEQDAEVLERALETLVDEDFVYRDRHAAVRGRLEFRDHVLAVQRFAPAGRVARDGEVRHCQGSALVAWKAEGADGSSLGSGTNAARFGGDGRLLEVVAFWS